MADDAPKLKPTGPRAHRLILPLGFRVLVKVLREDNRTDTGLYLPEGAKERHNEALYGEVIEVARNKPTTEEPAENVSGVPNGSRVLFRKDAGVRVPWDDSLRLLDVKDILATVEEHTDDEAH
ncbi:MAG: co-chaperone GroES [Deltaproteobacteria bacterium]|nr:MAG: co-chaperone GroES [Deltaproteobacteria bacterium]